MALREVYAIDGERMYQWFRIIKNDKKIMLYRRISDSYHRKLIIRQQWTNPVSVKSKDYDYRLHNTSFWKRLHTACSSLIVRKP